MREFWRLLRQSVIVQATLALSCVGAVIYLSVTGQPIPDVLVNVVMLIIGFYFGAKSVVQSQESSKGRTE